MKANLPQREPEMLKFWESIDVYGQIRAARAGNPVYVLHDGPPYANGAIHMGTAINKILKDIIVKSRTMMGFNAPYVPGWDCHGLPIEIKVDQMLGPRKASMSKAAIRQECRKYAEKYIDLQRKGFKRLEGFGEWNKPYLTMDYSYEADIVRTFGEFVEKGLVYKGLKPVYWCFSCKTALAEAEVEYEDHVSPSIYVAFPVESDLPIWDWRVRIGRSSSGPPRPGPCRPTRRWHFIRISNTAVCGSSASDTLSPPRFSRPFPGSAVGKIR